MRVGFLLASVSRQAGGLFQSVPGLANAVASPQVQAEVFGLRDGDTASDLSRWTPLNPHVFDRMPGTFAYSASLKRAVGSAGLDVLSTHGLWSYCSVVSCSWGKDHGDRYVVHPHGMLDHWAVRNSKWKKRFAGFLFETKHLRNAGCIRALNEAEARSIRDFGLTNPICVIPNGIDLPQSGNQRLEIGGRKSARGDLTSDIGHLTSGRRSLLYLGRLHPKKNLGALLRAWARVQSSEGRGLKSEEWCLLIAGWDQAGHEGELKRLARELRLSFSEVGGRRSEVLVSLTSDLGLLTSVSFVGPKIGADKEALYRSCDAFILPSLSEGLPMVVLEAWAYGKPVLITPECNLPEGFAAEAALKIRTSPEAIATGLNQLTEMNDEERAAMGARGRALVADKFSWPRIGEQMRAVYQWVLGGGPVPACVRLG